MTDRQEAAAGNGFDAFASYSTRADSRLVRAVERRLESFHETPQLPADRVHPLRICVDGSDFCLARLPAAERKSPEGETKIQNRIRVELGRSRVLLVFWPGCGLEGSFMAWEFRAFLQEHQLPVPREDQPLEQPPERVFLVLTHGEPRNDADGAYFSDWIRKARLHTEGWYDLRGYYGSERGRAGVADFEEEVVRLAADLNGCSSDELLPAWKRERDRVLQRRQKQALMVAVAMAMLAGLAIWQWYVASERRKEAERLTRQATARALAAEALVALPRSPQRALLLGAEAMEVTTRHREPRVAATEAALRQALSVVGGIPLAGHRSYVSALTAAGSRRLLSADGAGEIRMWTIGTHGWAGAVMAPPIGAAVQRLVWSATNGWIAAAHANGIVQAWRPGAADGPPFLMISNQVSAGTRSLVFSADGRWLAAGSTDYTAREFPVDLWELRGTNAPRHWRTMDAEEAMTHLWFSADSGRLYALGAGYTLTDQEGARPRFDREIRSWNLLPGGDAKTRPSMEMDRPIGSDAVVQDSTGRWLVTGDIAGWITCWPMEPEATEPSWSVRAVREEITRLVLDSKDRLLFIGTRSGAVSVWRWTPGKLPTMIADLTGPGRAVSHLVADPSGEWLVAAGVQDPQLFAWSLKDLRPETAGRILRGHAGPIMECAVSPTGDWLVSAGSDSLAMAWPLKQAGGLGNTPPVSLRGLDSAPAQIAFATDGSWVALSSSSQIVGADTQIRVWPLHPLEGASQPVRLATPAPRSGWSVSPDGLHLVGFGVDEEKDDPVLTMTTDTASTWVPIEGHRGRLGPVVFTKDSRWLAIADDEGGVSILKTGDPAGGFPRQRLQRFEGAVLDATFNPAGTVFVAGDNEGMLRGWQLGADGIWAPLRELRMTDSAVSEIQFTADGSRLITGWDRTLRVDSWSDTRREPMGFDGFPQQPHRLGLSADGRWVLATDIYGRYAALHDVEAGVRTWQQTFPEDSDARVEDALMTDDGSWYVLRRRGGTTTLRHTRHGEDAGDFPVRLGTARFLDGSRWFIAEDTTTRSTCLWSVSDFPALDRRRVLSRHDRPVSGYHVSPDGRWLLAVEQNDYQTSEAEVAIWEMVPGGPVAEPARFRVVDGGGGPAFVRREASGPWEVAFISSAGVLEIWALDWRTLPELARRVAGRSLKAGEASWVDR